MRPPPVLRLSRHAFVALGLLYGGLALSAPARAIGDGASPVGVWRTFDDSGHETGRVAIEERKGRLSGRIVGILDAAKARGTCFKCTDDRKDQPAMGLEIMRGMRADGDRWDGGTVLDPENGRAYDATMRLTDGGRRLVLRGYIGISLFGRSQTWERAQ
jgi:uncharacterized protein (DUF2147 family)